jgi:hypothetical protein
MHESSHFVFSTASQSHHGIDFDRAGRAGSSWRTPDARTVKLILLAKRARQPKSLSKFFAELPLAKMSIDLERKPDYGRAVEL